MTTRRGRPRLYSDAQRRERKAAGASTDEAKVKRRTRVKSRLDLLSPERRRARSLQTQYRAYGVKISIGDAVALVIFRPACPYCGRNYGVDELSVDHMVPQARGGKDLGPDNLHLTCRRCNFMKGALNDEEFRLLLEFLSLHPEMGAIVEKRLLQSGAVFGGRRGRRSA